MSPTRTVVGVILTEVRIGSRFDRVISLLPLSLPPLLSVRVTAHVRISVGAEILEERLRFDPVDRKVLP